MAGERGGSFDADVIVVGAGAAGLAAARALAARSLRIIVVEARDRIGGRVLWTDGSDGREAVELGAEFIHGNAPETMALLSRAGGSAVALGREPWTVRVDGSLTRDDVDSRLATDIFAAALALDADESVDAYLHRFDHDPSSSAKVALARAFVEGFDAADPSIASVLGIVDELRSGIDYATHRPSDGYRPLFETLRDDCIGAGAAMLFSAMVRRIRWRRGEVVVRASIDGTPGEFSARAAVVTLPVGVLRAPGHLGVVFEPALPEQTRAALDRMEMGHVVKVVLRFRSPFWERIADGRYRGASFFRCPYGAFPAYWTRRPLPGASIVAWAGGTYASALGGVSREGLVERALDEFARIFGDSSLARAELLDGAVHDWSADPFSRGAYSYIAVGGRSARERLGVPVEETLFIAGEATSTDGQGGTVNGAIATGQRAGREVAQAFGAESR